MQKDQQKKRTLIIISDLSYFNIARNDVIKTEDTIDNSFDYEYYIKPLDEIDES